MARLRVAAGKDYHPMLGEQAVAAVWEGAANPAVAGSDQRPAVAIVVAVAHSVEEELA
jgi:hypothetical protein